MNSTKINWILLILFCVLTAIFCIVLVMTPADGDKINMLGRIGLWSGIIASVMSVAVQVSEICRKNRENKQ